MKNIKKLATLVTASTLSAGILLGSVPTTASAKTSPKIVQAQANLKKQVSAYTKTLNSFKNEIRANDRFIYGYYSSLQADIKAFTTYNYTGKDALVKKTATFKTKIDKTRKDNSAVDMKKVTATFNTYIKKADAKNAKSYYAKQRAKLVAILNYQDNFMYDIEEYADEIEFQIYTENDIYIHNQLPTEYGNYESEMTKALSRMIGSMVKVQEITSYAYEVLNMDYTTYNQIQTDSEKIVEKYYNGFLGTEDNEDLQDLENDDLSAAIQKRDVVNAKIALLNAMDDIKKLNDSFDKMDLELKTYKENLTVKFADKVKEKPADKPVTQ